MNPTTPSAGARPTARPGWLAYGDPNAPNRALRERILNGWARQHDLRPAPPSPCLSVLAGLYRRCPFDKGESVEHYHDSGVDDHVSWWRRGSRPYCYVAQPYAIGGPPLSELAKVAGALDLDVLLEATSWHNPGQTLFVVLFRSGDDPPCLAPELAGEGLAATRGGQR